MPKTHSWNPNFYKLSPLFNPLIPAIQNFRFNQNWPSLSDYNHAVMQAEETITTTSKKPITFVNQVKPVLDFSNQYEPKIYLQGEVQTREQNWHDFFNMLAWLTFPHAKAMLNKQQYLLLKNRLEIDDNRSPAENFLTLFDENGAIIISCNPELSNLLCNFQWEELFWHHRKDVMSDMQFYVLGHSIYEKGLNPYIGMTASAIIFPVMSNFFSQNLKNQLAAVDLLLTKYLSNDENISLTQRLNPLPLLGIPGWSSDNNSLSYYQNTAYFRRARSEK